MHIHILGICGTLMASIARLAKEAGFDVSGSDQDMYPPMGDQLRSLQIPVQLGYTETVLEGGAERFIVGNVMKRGMPVIEELMNRRLSYQSGPEWLADEILRHRTVIAVTGTHGKTTTASMIAWILDQAGLHPGFLIGGIPENFSASARLGTGRYFVIEGDEYDSSFFDKRPKFLHYRPEILVLNNLEYDHADIYPNLDAIKLQFHYLLRTMPGNGLIVNNALDDNLNEVIAKGCWTPAVDFAGKNSAWQATLVNADGSHFKVQHVGENVGEVHWELMGMHNIHNALSAIAVATHVGVPIAVTLQALNQFVGVKRRLEVKAKINDITLYDDFAHHPTAIAVGIAALRLRIGNQARMIVLVELGSNSMRLGAHAKQLPEALRGADIVGILYPPNTLQDNTMPLPEGSGSFVCDDINIMIERVKNLLQVGDHVLMMSNRSFYGIHDKLITILQGEKMS